MEKTKTKITGKQLLLKILIYENILGGAGRILQFRGITLRYFLFGFSIMFFLINIKRFKISKTAFYVLVTLIACILFGIFNGFLKGNEFGNIFSQSKGYLFLLMVLPYCLLIDSKKAAQEAIKSFVNACFILSVIILIIFILLFNSRVAIIIYDMLPKLEIGHIATVNSFYRIFFKAHPLICVGLMFMLLQLFNKKKGEKKLSLYVKVGITGFAVVISLTMGLWLAAFIAIIIMIVLSFTSKERQKLFAFLPVILLVVVFASDFFIAILSTRLSADDSSAIIKANQLTVMLQQWMQNPIFGKGYGNVVTFTLEASTRVMLTIENSWAEILTTFGIIGFSIFVIFFVYLVKKAYVYSKRAVEIDEKIMFQGLYLGIIIFCVVSIFNPFIVNPMGLGYISLTFSILNNKILDEYAKRKLLNG